MVKTYFKGIRKIIVEQIQNSEKEILVAVAWFTNHDLFNALCDKLKNGTGVKLCLINDEINNREGGLNFQTFISLGGELYFSKGEELMHHKFCIIDNSILFNGSYNWTYYAENRNRENVILFNNFPDVISDFKEEFDLTISNSELVKDYSKYLIFNKPQYTQELSKYLSYDIYYQAKQITSINKYNEAKELIKTSLKYHSENMEAQIEQEKLDVVIKTTDIKNAVADENKKTPLDINKILKEHQQIIFDNYISNNPNREKAFLSANAIFEYERATNYLNIDSYNSVNPGYIMMVFGEYDKAEEFFKRNSSALGFYDLGVLNLLRNDYTKFALYINKALSILGSADQACAALYIPKVNKGMTEYVEKKQTNLNSTETISLKSTIAGIKQDYSI